MEAGRIEEAREQHEALAHLADELRQPLFRHFAAVWDVVWAQIADRPADIERLAERAHALGVARGRTRRGDDPARAADGAAAPAGPPAGVPAGGGAARGRAGAPAGVARGARRRAARLRPAGTRRGALRHARRARDPARHDLAHDPDAAELVRDAAGRRRPCRAPVRAPASVPRAHRAGRARRELGLGRALPRLARDGARGVHARRGALRGRAGAQRPQRPSAPAHPDGVRATAARRATSPPAPARCWPRRSTTRRPRA